jgi:hypothetical protein
VFKRIKVQGQSRQIVHETPISKTTREIGTGCVAQGVRSPEFKPQSCPKKDKVSTVILSKSGESGFRSSLHPDMRTHRQELLK